MVNQLNEFIPNLASHLKLFCELLSSQNQCRWEDAQENLFQKVKAALTTSETLCAFNPSLEMQMHHHDYGVGTV